MQPSGQRAALGRLGHPGFDSALRVALDYLIHGFGGWGCVSGVYLLSRGVSQEPCLGEVSSQVVGRLSRRMIESG